MDFVGAVADELFVGEFVFGRDGPGSEAPEYFIGLCGWMYVNFAVVLYSRSFFGFYGCRRFFFWFLFLLVFLFLLLFFGFVGALSLLLLLLIFGGFGFGGFFFLLFLEGLFEL